MSFSHTMRHLYHIVCFLFLHARQYPILVTNPPRQGTWENFAYQGSLSTMQVDLNQNYTTQMQKVVLATYIKHVRYRIARVQCLASSKVVREGGMQVLHSVQALRSWLMVSRISWEYFRQFVVMMHFVARQGPLTGVSTCIFT